MGQRGKQACPPGVKGVDTVALYISSQHGFAFQNQRRINISLLFHTKTHKQTPHIIRSMYFIYLLPSLALSVCLLQGSILPGIPFRFLANNKTSISISTSPSLTLSVSLSPGIFPSILPGIYLPPSLPLSIYLLSPSHHITTGSGASDSLQRNMIENQDNKLLSIGELVGLALLPDGRATWPLPAPRGENSKP